MCIQMFWFSVGFSVGSCQDCSGSYQPKSVSQEEAILLGIVVVGVMGEWESFIDMVVFYCKELE